MVCGEGQEAVGLLFYPNPTMPRGEVEAAVRAGLEQFNARAKGSGGKIARALVLDSRPTPHAGEITDKGYIAQADRPRPCARPSAADADPVFHPM